MFFKKTVKTNVERNSILNIVISILI